MNTFNQLGLGYRIVVLLLVVYGFVRALQSRDVFDLVTGLVLAGIVFAIGWKRGRSSAPSAAEGKSTRIEVKGDGEFSLPVVGESHYQDVLEAICGPRKEEGEEKEVEATLILDDANRYDKQAVRVEIAGQLVGYLSREDARAYRQMLARLGLVQATATCRAQIVGGWERQRRSGVDRGSYGVALDVVLD